MRIVIPGGSGQIGSMLALHFQDAGSQVTILSRHLSPLPWKAVLWNGVTAGAWISELEGSDVCINLSGRSVNCRYTEENRQAIYNSRIQSTTLLNEVIGKLQNPPKLWLNASTAAIYRQAYDHPMDEQGELGGDEPGVPSSWNFPVEVAKAWEKSFFSTETPRTRKVALRISLVMTPDRGGAFDVLSGFTRRGMGGKQGSGRQYVSWIHEADFIRAVDCLISREDIAGVVNVASPNPLPNRDFMWALRKAWGVPIGLPASKWMIKAGARLMSTEPELVLKSRRVVPGILLAAGFAFEFPEWPSTARDLVERRRRKTA